MHQSKMSRFATRLREIYTIEAEFSRKIRISFFFTKNKSAAI